MPLYDYKCTFCDAVEESLMPSGTEAIKCAQCGSRATRVFLVCPKQLTTIVPSYPGCKKQKAGYVHSHGDKPKTKVQGCGF